MSTRPRQRPRRAVRREVAIDDPGRTRPPAVLPPSSWVLGDPAGADEDGVVGVGADLAPPTLVDAYRRGIFPWPHDASPLPWFSPDPRGMLTPDALVVSRSLRRTLRNSGWTATVDTAFADVVAACTDRADGTWITPAMARAYQRLNDLGWARSVEVWEGDDLVGGLYGVQLGAVFTGESMFHRRSDASKVALVELTARFAAAGGAFVDVQIVTEHLASLGARTIPRTRFLRALHDLRDRDVRMSTVREAVDRLAG